MILNLNLKDSSKFNKKSRIDLFYHINKLKLYFIAFYRFELNLKLKNLF